MVNRRRILLNTPHIKEASGAIANFKTDVPANLKKCVVEIEPVQDLHGYEYPWPPGGGKNKLPNNAVTSTIQGVTFTVNSDGSITANGTSTGWTGLEISTFTLPAGNYKLFSLVENRSYFYNYYLDLLVSGVSMVNTSAEGQTGVAFSLSEDTEIVCKLFARPNNVLSNVVCKPMITLSSVTDVSYAPYSNICPISGRTEMEVNRTKKNLFYLSNPSTANGVTLAALPDGRFVLNGTATSNYNFTRSISGMTIKAGTYTLSLGNPSNEGIGTRCDLYLPDTNNLYQVHSYYPYGTSTFVLDSDYTGVVNFRMRIANGVTYTNFIIAPQLELGLTATEYEPYNATTIPITFPSSAGTVYGGTLDLLSGVLTVDRAIVDLGSITDWTIQTINQRIYKICPYMKPTPDSTTVPKMLCNRFKAITFQELYSNKKEGLTISSGSALQLHINGLTDSSNVTLEQVNQYFANNPTQVVYELANPTTYQLTAQTLKSLRGVNNIWSDAGDTTVKYWGH